MMLLKTFFFFVFVLSSLILSGCDRTPTTPADTYVGARKSARHAAETANLDTVRHSVEAYRAVNGNYPGSLKDVEDMLGAQIDLSRYDYDPKTGAVTLKTQQ
jgi:hypothetical protein